MSEETSKTFTEVAIMHAQELDRLRSVNVELLAALQEIMDCDDVETAGIAQRAIARALG